MFEQCLCNLCTMFVQCCMGAGATAFLHCSLCVAAYCFSRFGHKLVDVLHHLYFVFMQCCMHVEQNLYNICTRFAHGLCKCVSNVRTMFAKRLANVCTTRVKCLFNVWAVFDQCFVQCLCNVSTMFGQYLSNVWTMFVQSGYKVCTMFAQCLHGCLCSSIFALFTIFRSLPLMVFLGMGARNTGPAGTPSYEIWCFRLSFVVYMFFILVSTFCTKNEKAW